MSAAFYIIQHTYADRQPSDAWDSTGDGGQFLFDKLPFSDYNGEVGNGYRALVAPTHRVWQETGLTGFETNEQAWAVVDAIEARGLTKDRGIIFRVCTRTIVQTTESVPRPTPPMRFFIQHRYWPGSGWSHSGQPDFVGFDSKAEAFAALDAATDIRTLLTEVEFRVIAMTRNGDWTEVERA